MKCVLFALLVAASAVTVAKEDVLGEANKALKDAIDNQLDVLEQEAEKKVYGLTDQGKACLEAKKQAGAKVKACEKWKMEAAKGDEPAQRSFKLECEQEVKTATPYEACWEAIIALELFTGDAKDGNAAGICSTEAGLSSKKIQKWCNEMQNEVSPNYGAWEDGQTFAAHYAGKAEALYNKDYDGTK